MISVKTLTFIHILALFSRGVVSQKPTVTPNASLYIPFGSQADTGLDPGEFLVASAVAVSDSSTVLVIVDNAPTPIATFTEVLSPSGVSLESEDCEEDEDQIENVTCTFNDDGTSTCEVVRVAQVFEATTTVVSSSSFTFTEPVTSLPVVAVNFTPSPGSKPTATTSPKSKPTNTNTHDNAAVSSRSSFGLVNLIALCIVFNLM